MSTTALHHPGMNLERRDRVVLASSENVPCLTRQTQTEWPPSSEVLPDTAVKEEPATQVGPTLSSSVSSGTTEGTKSIPGCSGPASPGKPDD
ncbi:hypothetical protein E2C01_046822 [Portunus trituberculatus]|uniref:Uncharacterized protein n=1 Tax=Portunus trituberculatus TaxID=210409 RepID=A0A5B7G1Y8_PORTR|nr:hypothetical protein [Portunus trituberculatus]